MPHRSRPTLLSKVLAIMERLKAGVISRAEAYVTGIDKTHFVQYTPAAH
jgi:hypothetical protein